MSYLLLLLAIVPLVSGACNCDYATEFCNVFDMTTCEKKRPAPDTFTFCGDTVCQSLYENRSTCAADCGPSGSGLTLTSPPARRAGFNEAVGSANAGLGSAVRTASIILYSAIGGGVLITICLIALCVWCIVKSSQNNGQRVVVVNSQGQVIQQGGRPPSFRSSGGSGGRHSHRSKHSSRRLSQKVPGHSSRRGSRKVSQHLVQQGALGNALAAPAQQQTPQMMEPTVAATAPPMGTWAEGTQLQVPAPQESQPPPPEPESQPPPPEPESQPPPPASYE